MKRQKTEHKSKVVNEQKAIDAHKKKMEAKGWTFERSWCYEGVTSHINLLYKKEKTTPEPEPKVMWRKLKLKARLDDGTKNFMGGDYTVCETAQEVECHNCHKTIQKGIRFTVRGKHQPLPICRECSPFEAYDP